MSVVISMLSVAIGCDHAGVPMKDALAEMLAANCTVYDLGTDSEASVDYPDYAEAVAALLHEGKAKIGILICGSGIGMSIAANRFGHIRAALCHTPEQAILARQHNDANVLCLGSRMIDQDTAEACVQAFMDTRFEGGRHEKRIQKLSGA